MLVSGTQDPIGGKASCTGLPSLAGHHGGHFFVDTGTAILFRASCSTPSLTLAGTAGKTL